MCIDAVIRFSCVRLLSPRKKQRPLTNVASMRLQVNTAKFWCAEHSTYCLIRLRNSLWPGYRCHACVSRAAVSSFGSHVPRNHSGYMDSRRTHATSLAFRCWFGVNWKVHKRRRPWSFCFFFWAEETSPWQDPQHSQKVWEAKNFQKPV